VAHQKWLPYFVRNNADSRAELYPADNLKRPTGPLCDGCHSVIYNPRTKTVTEWNVGCEHCHGPGADHIVHPSSIPPGWTTFAPTTFAFSATHKVGH